MGGEVVPFAVLVPVEDHVEGDARLEARARAGSLVHLLCDVIEELLVQLLRPREPDRRLLQGREGVGDEVLHALARDAVSVPAADAL